MARLVAIAALVLVGLGIGGFLVYARPQPLLPEATAALASTPVVDVATVGHDVVFRPTGVDPTVGLILYPGGKVPPAAYAPAARDIAAQAGVLVEIVDVPFNLAVFDIDAPARVIGREPGIRTWSVGGHSLGGAMAAQFVGSHPGLARGLVLWASYPAIDLSTMSIRVLSIHGTLDAGAATFTSDATRAKLPGDPVFVTIAGGNHEQMGWYTGQPNDPPATIPRDEQTRQVVGATAAFLEDLGATTGG